MRDLAIGGIGDRRGREQARRPALGDVGQEAVEPGRELGGGEHAAQAFGLDQGRGEEVVAGRLFKDRPAELKTALAGAPNAQP